MRSTRITAALVALVMIAALPFLAGGSATAQKAKTKHTISSNTGLKEVKRNTFIAKGTVSTFKNKRVTIQQKTCAKCSWHRFKKVKTSRTGFFRTGVAFSHRSGGVFYYRLSVPKTIYHRATLKNLGYIKTY